MVLGLGCYNVCDLLDLVFIVVVIVGVCIGFLWWNVVFVKIFMGDIGLLVLGGVIVGLLVISCIEIFVVVLGVLFVVEIILVVL